MGAVVSPYQVLSGQLAALLAEMHEQLHTELATAPAELGESELCQSVTSTATGPGPCPSL